MNAPIAEALGALLDDELDGERRALLEARLAQEPALRETMAKQNMGEGYLDAPDFKALIARDNAFFKQLIGRLDIRA